MWSLQVLLHVLDPILYQPLGLSAMIRSISVIFWMSVCQKLDCTNHMHMISQHTPYCVLCAHLLVRIVQERKGLPTENYEPRWHVIHSREALELNFKKPKECVHAYRECDLNADCMLFLYSSHANLKKKSKLDGLAILTLEPFPKILTLTVFGVFTDPKDLTSFKIYPTN